MSCDQCPHCQQLKAEAEQQRAARRAGRRERHNEISMRWQRNHPEKAMRHTVARRKRLNTRLRETAANHGKEWTGPELECIIDHPEMTAAELALRLGRTYAAVRNMRHRLKDGNPVDRMLAAGPAPPTSRSGPR